MHPILRNFLTPKEIKLWAGAFCRGVVGWLGAFFGWCLGGVGFFSFFDFRKAAEEF